MCYIVNCSYSVNNFYFKSYYNDVKKEYKHHNSLAISISICRITIIV